MNCEQAETFLAAYVFGDVPPEMMDELRRHFEACETCSSRVRDLRATAGLLEEALAAAEEPALSDDRQAALAALKWPARPKPKAPSAEPAWWHLPVVARYPLTAAACAVLIALGAAGLFLPSLGTGRSDAQLAGRPDAFRPTARGRFHGADAGVEVWKADPSDKFDEAKYAAKGDSRYGGEDEGGSTASTSGVTAKSGDGIAFDAKSLAEGDRRSVTPGLAPRSTTSDWGTVIEKSKRTLASVKGGSGTVHADGKKSGVPILGDVPALGSLLKTTVAEVVRRRVDTGRLAEPAVPETAEDKGPGGGEDVTGLSALALLGGDKGDKPEVETQQRQKIAAGLAWLARTQNGDETGQVAATRGRGKDRDRAEKDPAGPADRPPVEKPHTPLDLSTPTDDLRVGTVVLLSDGRKVGGKYDNVRRPGLATNGEALAFEARSDGKTLVVRNGPGVAGEGGKPAPVILAPPRGVGRPSKPATGLRPATEPKLAPRPDSGTTGRLDIDGEGRGEPRGRPDGPRQSRPSVVRDDYGRTVQDYFKDLREKKSEETEGERGGRVSPSADELKTGPTDELKTAVDMARRKREDPKAKELTAETRRITGKARSGEASLLESEPAKRQVERTYEFANTRRAIADADKLIREGKPGEALNKLNAARDATKVLAKHLDVRRERDDIEAKAAHCRKMIDEKARAERDRKKKPVRVNPFVRTRIDNQSTFALETDTGSFTRTRAAILRRHVLPPTRDVRVEEFVNWLDHHYSGRHRNAFSIHATAGPSVFRPKLTLIKIGVKAKVAGRNGRRPNNLVLCFDTSSSMGTPDRLPLAQAAAGMLITGLSEGDRVSVVTYGTRARLILDVTPIRGNRKRILDVIRSLQPGGSTNVAQGLGVAYQQAQKTFKSGQNNSVLLISDGIANIGPATAKSILANVKNDRRQGIMLTCVGVGSGQYNDTLMEQLANNGDGRYLFIDTKDEARRVFVDELAKLQIVAKDAKIQVEFDPRVVRRYRLLGYENRDIADADFRNDAVDAGEIGSGQSATALYEVELLRKTGRIGTVHVRYRDVETGRVEEIASPIRAEAKIKRGAKTPARFRLAACAAQFAEILRGSPYVRGGSLKDIEAVLSEVRAELPLDDKAAELHRLVHEAHGLPRAR